MVRKPDSFEQNIFVNCPFDEIYTPLFNAIVFTIHDMGFRPRCALEASNAGQVRLDKILGLISDCKYSIHDLSRTELDPNSGLPRFNMPLELGLDLGCKTFGNSDHRQKVSLILDREPYRYQVFISDIAGQDISSHGGDPKNVIRVVRDWLRREPDPQKIVPGGVKIYKRYTEFQRTLPALCAKLNWDTKQLAFPDFSLAVSTWLKANPL